MGLTRPRLGQLQTTTSAFDDPIVVFNNNASGTNTKDIGIVFERGDDQNKVLLWDESADEFVLANSTEQGSTSGDVTLASYANLHVNDLIAEGTITMNGNVQIGDAATDTISLTADVDSNIIPSADNTYSLGDSSNSWSHTYTEDLTVGDVATYNTVEYSNSNTMKFNQLYLGNSSGSYFTDGEYQKVVTIIPSSSSQNYLVMGRITAQNGGSVHIVDFEVALRSETLPSLSYSTQFTEYYTQQLIKPLLWVKQTTTAGFIVAFEILNSTIYGNVTADIDVVPRASAQKANVTINNATSSEQASVESGYTSVDMVKMVTRTDSGITVGGNILPSAHETYDLGSSSLRWNDLYLSGETINLGGTKMSKDSDGNVTFKDESDTLKKVIASEIELGSGADKIKIKRGDDGSVRFTDKDDTRTKADLNENDTGDLTEGSNLYYTDARVNTYLTTTGINSNYTFPTADGTANQVLETDGSGKLSWTDVATTLDAVTDNGATTTNSITVGGITASGLAYPTSDGSANQFLQTNGSGALTFASATVSDISDLTATAAELNKLDGLTATTTELNYVDGVTSAIQTQIDGKLSTSGGTITSNLTVTGNLTVNGTTTTVATTNMVVSDNLIELNNGASSNANDSGIVIERGSTGDNAIIMWDESADAFAMGTTTATGTSTGNLTVTHGALLLDTLRIDQAGTGLRMTNVGAFDNDGSDNFRIFSTNDLQLKANGDSGAGLTIDVTNQDVTIDNDLRVSAGQFYYGGTAVTSTATELNILDGVTATTAELNKMDGVTATTTELNYTDGVTSNIQTQLDAKLPLAGGTMTGALTLNAQNQLRFADSDSSNYVGFKSPATVSSDIMWTLPSSDGTEGQVLSTNGGGTLSWEDQSSGGGSGSSYPNSTFSTVPGTDGDFDLSYNVAQDTQETPFEASGTDAFGVNLGSVYSLMDPIGSTESLDLGALT